MTESIKKPAASDLSAAPCSRCNGEGKVTIVIGADPIYRDCPECAELMDGDESTRELYRLLVTIQRDLDELDETHLKMARNVWAGTVVRAEEIMQANKRNALRFNP